MNIRLLLVSDIHGNYPALRAIERKLDTSSFDRIVNCGDSLVYGPFANKTLSWLRKNRVISILGNTDKKVLKLLRGKSFTKPAKAEKRIMYYSTARSLTKANRRYLLSLSKSARLDLVCSDSAGAGKTVALGMYHGSPAHHHEFLFHDTPNDRFRELAAATDCEIIVTGHSHSPYHKKISGVHFINPGSVGRMFDSDPRASCATLDMQRGIIHVTHYRIPYPVEKVAAKIREKGLPEIYATMFRQGRKLN